MQTLIASITAPLEWVTGMAGGSEYLLARWIFLRLLGVIYLIAFLSLWVQIKGLIGSQGILPIGDTLQALRENLGPERYRVFPTVFWLNASDAALHIVCALGVVSSLFVVFNLAPTLTLALAWALYLSLTTAGQDFLSFQWDILLLEAGLLSVFFAPWGLRPGLGTVTPLFPVFLFLLWWLLFRLMFESGFVKLTSGDPSWRDFTAFDYHYWTQPLPTWTAWTVHHLPRWFHASSMVFMYIAELLLPLLVFTVRPLRIVAALGMAALQLTIGLTGNYTFFNLLSIVLAIPLIDDALWRWLLPAGALASIGTGGQLSVLPPIVALPALLIGVILFLVASVGLLETLVRGVSIPSPIATIVRWVEPLRSTNSYGLFRVMTKRRPEIIVEGSDDQQTWKAYEFRWKPGDITRRPAFIEPHQPRLDWQMWFAALGSLRSERWPAGRSLGEGWFTSFMLRLLQGSPDVLNLLKVNPFPGHPPRFVRAMLYDYRFTSPEERRRTGAWWKRALVGTYMEPASLRER